MRRPIRRRPARIVVAAGLACATIGVAGCASSSGAGVVVAVAAPRTLFYSPTGSGPVVAGVDRAVVIERRATVVSVDAVEGQLVTAGQPLLQVYTIGQSAAVATATNLLLADQRQLPFVRAQSGVLGARTLALLNQIAEDRQNLTALKNTPTVITAPVTGRVSGLDTLPGSTLDRSDAVLHVLDDRAVRVAVPMVVGYLSQLKVGQAATLTLPSLPGRTFAATIAAIGTTVPANPNGKTLGAEETAPVTVQLQNPAQTVTPGTTAYVRFPLVRSAPVAVNALAVLGQDQPFVFVVHKGVVRQRPVVVGVSDGTWTEIESGVQPGDEVVISGGARLVDGAAVHISRSQDS